MSSTLGRFAAQHERCVSLGRRRCVAHGWPRGACIACACAHACSRVLSRARLPVPACPRPLARSDGTQFPGGDSLRFAFSCPLELAMCHMERHVPHAYVICTACATCTACTRRHAHSHVEMHAVHCAPQAAPRTPRALPSSRSTGLAGVKGQSQHIRRPYGYRYSAGDGVAPRGNARRLGLEGVLKDPLRSPSSPGRRDGSLYTGAI